MPGSTDEIIVAQTQQWITSVVVGLNLCPFARRVVETNRIRYRVSHAADSRGLLKVLTDELLVLTGTSMATVETSFLIHPDVLQDFYDYNDFLDQAELCIDRLDLEGVIQIASFHPQYQFADTSPDDLENYTNRSPYPMLHLLREESITRVAKNPDDLLQIPENNRQTLQKLGRAALMNLLKTTHPGRLL